MKKLLIDTSVIIDFLRRKDKEDSLFYKLSEEDLYISIVTHTEIFAGKRVWESNKTRKVIEDLFLGFHIIPLTEDISELTGYIKIYGKSNSLIDSVIAATSIKHNLELVTLNIKHFEKLPKVKLFRDFEE